MTIQNNGEAISGLNFIHLSDIHFKEPYCLNLATDSDHPIRVSLLRDIQSMLKDVGKIDGILVSGDIAYKGNREEYKVASNWLGEVCEAANCPKSSIYTVPGNHDVDRKAARERSVQGCRAIIEKNKDILAMDKELCDTCLDDKTGPELFIPMAEYNIFAAAYNCDLNRTRASWSEDLKLADGWILRLHGLTTTFLSGPDDDSKGELFLGSIQRSFADEDGIIRLAMMHHPPEWLRDQDELDDALWNNCSIHLFGHKHKQRYLASDTSVRLSAAAVNPNKAELGWSPGYNIFQLKVLERESKFYLQVLTHQRIWQQSPDGFIAKESAGEKIFKAEITLNKKPIPVPPAKVIQTTESTESIKQNPIEIILEKHMNLREIINHFWELTASDRRKLMQELNLIDAGDDTVPEPQRYRRAFERAQDRQQIDQLSVAISKVLKQK